MKRLFGFLLFIVGAIELVITVVFAARGIQAIFVASLIISVVLLVIGVILSYEEFEEEKLEDYRKNSPSNERLGQF